MSLISEVAKEIYFWESARLVGFLRIKIKNKKIKIKIKITRKIKYYNRYKLISLCLYLSLSL